MDNSSVDVCCRYGLLAFTFQFSISSRLRDSGNWLHLTKRAKTRPCLSTLPPSVHLLQCKLVLAFVSPGLNQDSNDIMFFPEKSYNPASDTSYVHWAARPKPMSFPMSRPSRNKMGAENEKEGKLGSSIRWVRWFTWQGCFFFFFKSFGGFFFVCVCVIG